jgi:protein-L-isoaspartate O-methyltransferase
MTVIDDTAALRADLADHLTGLRSPMWRDAFRAVPRHVFAPRFAIHDPATQAFVHHDLTDTLGRPAALAAAYTDDTLITRFDADGVPISSSTEPSLMAAMLEALDARPGHRVLEVGTGTGYNAALLCHALGQDNITSIDVDPDLIPTATAALAAAGYQTTVVCGNGATGVPGRAPFDRIIATCGVDRVPAAWPAQLAPDGAILVNVSKGIVLLRKHQRAVSGRFLSSAGFMPLRAPGDAARWDPRRAVAATSGDTGDAHAVGMLPELEFTIAAFVTALIADRSQLIFLHDEQERVTSYRWVHPPTGSWARVDLHGGGRATVHEHGPRRLWTELTPVLTAWQNAGRPGIERFGLTVTADGRHLLWLDHPDHPIELAHA